MGSPEHPQPAASRAVLRLPRWLVDDRFDAAMAGTIEGGWRDELPAIGLRALSIPALALLAWALILWGVTWIW